MNKYDVITPEVLGLTGAQLLVEQMKKEKAPGTFKIVPKGNQIIIRCNVKKTADALAIAFDQALKVVK